MDVQPGLRDGRADNALRHIPVADLAAVGDVKLLAAGDVRAGPQRLFIDLLDRQRRGRGAGLRRARDQLERRVGLLPLRNAEAAALPEFHRGIVRGRAPGELVPILTFGDGEADQREDAGEQQREDHQQPERLRNSLGRHIVGSPQAAPRITAARRATYGSPALR